MIDREAIAQRRRDQTIREGFGVVEQQLRLKEQALALELAGVDAALKSGDVTKANVIAQQRLTEQLAAYAKTREQIVSRRDTALAQSELVTLGQRSLREAGAAGAGRTVRATAAPAAEPPPVIVDMAALSREMQSFAVFTGGDLGPLSDALAESAEGFERASRALARARSPEELAAAAERAATASAAVGIAGSVARGNLGGAVTGLGSMLGPSAAALGPIGAAIGVAQGIGATAEAQGVSVADVTTQAVEGAVGALVAVIEGLPDIIAQTIPVLVSALVVELPIALVRALPDILAASLYNALIGLPKAIAEAIRDAITPGQEGGEPSTARLIGATVKGSFTGDIESEDVPTLIAAILLSRGRDRSRATSSRSATTARRAATTRPSPAAAPNPFRAFADAYVPVLLWPSDMRRIAGMTPAETIRELGLRTYRVQYQKALAEQIRDVVAEFWERHVVAMKPPEPRDLADAKRCAWAVAGKTVDADDELVELLEAREHYRQVIDDTEALVEQAEMQIRAKLGDAEQALGAGGKAIVSAKVVNRAGYTAQVKATSYRGLTVPKNWRNYL